MFEATDCFYDLIDDFVLSYLGFFGYNGSGSKYYRKLNPNYLDMAAVLSVDEEAKNLLVGYYNKSQRMKAKHLKNLENRLNTARSALSEECLEEDTSVFRYESTWCQEAIDALGGVDLADNKMK